MIFLSCGKVYSLPQDWPCEEITLTKSNTSPKTENVFQGNNGIYQITIINFDDNIKYSSYNCGNAGCLGKMTNLKTGQNETMRFDCHFDKIEKTLNCNRISGDEYILSKFSDNEYRVELCGNFYRYIYLDKCNECSCIVQDSRGNNHSTDYIMNCTKENEQQIHCFTHYGYEEWRNFENKENDYDNCIGLNL